MTPQAFSKKPTCSSKEHPQGSNYGMNQNFPKPGWEWGNQLCRPSIALVTPLVTPLGSTMNESLSCVADLDGVQVIFLKHVAMVPVMDILGGGGGPA